MLNRKLLCNHNHIFRQHKCLSVFSSTYSNLNKSLHPKLQTHSSLVRFSTYSRKQNAVPPEKPHQELDNKSKSKIIYIATGSVILAGSLFALWYSRISSKRKKLLETEEKDKTTKPVLKIPADSKDIPDKVPYLLVGGGTASFSAFRSIKSNDPTAKVLVISEESYYPYMRPPLLKEMFYADDDLIKKLAFKQWNGTERSLFYEPDDFYVACDKLITESKGGVAVARGWKVVQVLPFAKKVILDDGKEIEYDKCLIATGSRPKIIPPFREVDEKLKEKVSTFKTIDDFRQLHAIVSKGNKSVAIIGGNFVGSELACSIITRENNKNSVKVKQIIPEEGNMAQIIPHYLSLWTTNKVRDLGVDVICNTTVENISLTSDNSQVVLHLNNGSEVKVDHVVLASGSEPATDIADVSCLETHPQLGGFIVNTELAARSNLYAAGECACFYDIKFGRRLVEHHDHAVVSGRLAGENMTGAGKPYWHQSMFWSDLGPDIGLEGIGIVDSSLPTVGIFAKSSDQQKIDEKKSADGSNKSTTLAPLVTSAPKEGEDYGKGVIFYLRDDVIVGVVLWNLFNKMNLARQILTDPKKYDDLNEVAKLFEIHQG